jgi:hypothetical protein
MVDERGNTPYRGEFRVQSPGSKHSDRNGPRSASCSCCSE